MSINIDFAKMRGMIPVIIQDYQTLQVLMLGYMNEEAYLKTQETGKVTFFSRSKGCLWTKGETSGHYLLVKDILLDCDQDTLLILSEPKGPTCHTGSVSCFGNTTAKGFVYQLENTIHQRIESESHNSYTSSLYKKGINKVAQKVGEEAVELVIEAMDNNVDNFKGEAADLLFHYLILLKAKGIKFEDIEKILKERIKK